MYIYIYRRFRGVSPACPTPWNRVIVFVFAFVFVSFVRASGRGEAVRAHVERYPYRWASRELVVLRLAGCLGAIVAAIRMGFKHF